MLKMALILWQIAGNGGTQDYRTAYTLYDTGGNLKSIEINFWFLVKGITAVFWRIYFSIEWFIKELLNQVIILSHYKAWKWQQSVSNTAPMYYKIKTDKAEM
jgi:hypothetical protein